MGAADWTSVEKEFVQASRVLADLKLTNRDYFAILSCTRNFLYEAMKHEGDRHFVTWTKIARLDGTENANPLARMMEWSLPVLCDEEVFAENFDASPRMRSQYQTILDWIIGEDQKSGLLAMLESGDEMAKTLKKEAKLLLDYKKQLIAEQKNMEKEQRRQEKQKKREALSTLPDSELPFMEESDSGTKKKGFLGLFDKKK